MSESFAVRVDNAAVNSALARLVERLGAATPAMRDIAEQLRTETEQNFLDQGRPAWLPLAPSTVRERGNAHPILQRSGQLAASIVTDYSATHAEVGTNKVYGAIQQFGGQAGRGRRVRIPARPYLPVDSAGNLQPQAEQAVLEIIQDFLAD